MAEDLSKSLVLYVKPVPDTVLNDSKLQNTCLETNVKVETGVKTPAKKSVSSGKSNMKVQTGRKMSTTKSAQKENENTRKVEAKKPTAQARPSLACRNTNVETPKQDKVSPAGRKNVAPVSRSKTLKPVSCTCQCKEHKKEHSTRAEITVYPDSPTVTTTEKEGTKNKVELSKSWDSSTTAGRKSAPVKSKSSRLTVPENMKASTSLPDLTSINIPEEMEESMAGSKRKPRRTGRSLSKPKPRLARVKQGDPEFDEMVTKLESMFPNADPVFLRSEFVRLRGSLTETIESIIITEKTDQLPTRDEYVRRAEAERLQNTFLENFSVENFLKFIPDPWEYFLKTEKHNSASYLGHSLHYLKNKYKRHYLKAIHSALDKCGYSLYLADKELSKKNRLLRMRTTNRSKFECDTGRPTTFNTQFVHEVAFIENETEIKSYIKKTQVVKYKKFKEAEKAGTLLKCESCNDISLLQDDAVNCPSNHVFCKDCVVRWVGIEIDHNSFHFKCLMSCGERFSMESLQNILSPFVIAKIIQNHQLEEIQASGLKDLAYCPVCSYVAVLPPEITVFKCLNPRCMIQTCRLCKQLNHIPLKCHELEKLERTILKLEMDMQGYKEKGDKSLKCTDCSGERFKVKDSTQLICSCGTVMCSECRRPFRECQHSGVFRHSMSPSLDDDSDTSVSFHLDDDDTAGDAAKGESSEHFLPIEYLPSESDIF